MKSMTDSQRTVRNNTSSTVGSPHVSTVPMPSASQGPHTQTHPRTHTRCIWLHFCWRMPGGSMVTGCRAAHIQFSKFFGELTPVVAQRSFDRVGRRRGRVRTPWYPSDTTNVIFVAPCTVASWVDHEVTLFILEWIFEVQPIKLCFLWDPTHLFHQVLRLNKNIQKYIHILIRAGSRRWANMCIFGRM